MDRIRNQIRTQQNIGIGKSHDAEAMCLKPFGPAIIAPELVLFKMLASINFYNQPHLRTEEISNVWPERRLSSEPEAGKLLAP